MTVLKYFSIAFVLSALGTIPIGLITLTIAQKTIERGKSAGWKVALGATIIEFIYTLIALYGLDVLSVEADWKKYIQIATIILFLILGIYYLRKTTSQQIEMRPSTQGLDFFQGIGVGLMNMLIVPFWLVVGLWLESNGLEFEQTKLIIWFSIGAALGALLIFVVYIEGSKFVLNKSKKIRESANKIIGGLFIILALFQLIQLF